MKTPKIRQVLVRPYKLSPKKPLEVEEVHFEYRFWLITGEGIKAAKCSVELVVPFAEDTPALKIEQSPEIDGTAVSQLISGGTSGITYRVVCEINTTDGRVERTEAEIKVE